MCKRKVIKLKNENRVFYRIVEDDPQLKNHKKL